ncbi:hypothetical protein AOLI_G00105570 [Acnodon oligacanthus]
MFDSAQLFPLLLLCSGPVAADQHLISWGRNVSASVRQLDTHNRISLMGLYEISTNSQVHPLRSLYVPVNRLQEEEDEEKEEEGGVGRRKGKERPTEKERSPAPFTLSVLTDRPKGTTTSI